MKIGVFDSGNGGTFFLPVIKERFPFAEVVYKKDEQNFPYGDKTSDELLALVAPILIEFQKQGCSIVLIACNTVTTNIMDELRQMMNMPLVGVEPMMQEAVRVTKTGSIAVLATPGTLKSKRYADLKIRYTDDIDVIEPDCGSWASLIEQSRVDEIGLEDVLSGLRKRLVDVIVLGCTHYYWLEKKINVLTEKDIHTVQSVDLVIEQIDRLIRDYT